MKKTLHRLRQLILIRRRRAFDQQDKHKIRYVLVRGGSGFALAISLIAVIAILLSAFAYTRLTSDLPALDQLPLLLNPETGLLQSPTRIYDRTGKVVIATLENPGIPRHYVALDPDKPEHFSAYFTSTMVSINEPNFWSSPGYSLSEWNNPKPVTIAEKLVDSLLLETEPPGLRRSIRMRLLAAQLVNRYGRVQTLEWYLNSAYFGHLAYGADAAARLYFGKSVQEVNLAESAVLAAAALAPALNPIDAPKAAIEYQKSVLSAIHAAGFIPDAEYNQAIETAIEFTPVDQVPVLNQTAYIDLVLGQASALMGKQNIERGGLDIISTLDATLQTQVECVLRLQLSRIQAGETEITQKALTDCDAALFLSPLSQNTQSVIENVQGSAVILDLKTGEILALTGDLDSIGNEFAMQPHQAGSLLTPIVAVSAFSRGMSPATLVWDIPEMFPDW